VQPNDTILLDVSLGPHLYAVPDLANGNPSLQDAIAELKTYNEANPNAKFSLATPKVTGSNPFGLNPMQYPLYFKVDSQKPDTTKDGNPAQEPKGTKITLTVSFDFPLGG
jgi:hypothetical protein